MTQSIYISDINSPTEPSKIQKIALGTARIKPVLPLNLSPSPLPSTGGGKAKLGARHERTPHSWKFPNSAALFSRL